MHIYTNGLYIKCIKDRSHFHLIWDSASGTAARLDSLIYDTVSETSTGGWAHTR